MIIRFYDDLMFGLPVEHRAAAVAHFSNSSFYLNLPNFLHKAQIEDHLYKSMVTTTIFT